MKITKSFFKKTEQRNICVVTLYYVPAEIDDMIQAGTAFGPIDVYDSAVARIALENVDKLEVELGTDGYLTTVAIMKDGTKVYVEL